jgi:thiol-disulfide isomerase/thioredoxin
VPTLVQPGSGAIQWSVACLCAAWCDTCNDYRPAFDNLARDNADCAFVWIDIEDDSDWMGEIDIENFPTILICRGATPHFFGTVLPHIGQLQKLIASVRANDTALRAPHADLWALATRIRNEILK